MAGSVNSLNRRNTNKRNPVKVKHKSVKADSCESEKPDSPFSTIDAALPLSYWYITGIFYLSLLSFFRFNSRWVPTPDVSRNDTDPYKFQEASARAHLFNLTTWGSHAVGSVANEYYLPLYLIEQLRELQDTATSANQFLLDAERITGSFAMNCCGNFVSCYENINNIVVKLGPKDSNTSSVLVNCHYDSVSASIAAGDNLASCSVMIEIIRILSQLDTPLNKSVIFLFSGADENLLQGSHSFITYHSWSKDVAAFINLEACGSGGKEVLVHSGPSHPWLVQIYAKVVPIAFTSLLGGHLIDRGILPTDASYKIFQSNNEIPGIKIAHIGSGFVAQTSDDEVPSIPPGALLKCGENLLALIRGVVKAPFLQTSGDYSESIRQTYLKGTQEVIDVMGLSLMSFPSRLTRLSSIFLCVMVFIEVGIRQAATLMRGEPAHRHLLNCLLAVVLSWCAALLSPLLLALLLDASGFAMCWYSFHWLILGLYTAPTLTIIIQTHVYFRQFTHKDADGFLMEDGIYDVHLLLYSVGLLCMVWFRAKVMPYFFIWLALAYTTRAAFRYTGTNPYRRPLLWCTGHLVIASILPSTLFLQAVYVSLSYMIPLFGRSGSEVIPDLYIALVSSVCTIATSSFQVGQLYLSRRVEELHRLLVVASCASLLLITLTPLGFPYHADEGFQTRQRHLVQHISRVMHSSSGAVIHQDSGLLHTPLDRNGIILLRPHVSELHSVRPVKCEKGPYCSWPYYWPIAEHSKKMYYIPCGRPNIRSTFVATLNLTRRETLGNIHKLHFNLSGSSHMNIYMSPRPNVHLTNWSMTDTPPLPTMMSPVDSRPSYFVFYSYGIKPNHPWQFWIELKVPAAIGIDPVLDIAMAAQYFNLNGEPFLTHEARRYVKQLPGWTTVMPWVSLYESWIY